MLQRKGKLLVLRFLMQGSLVLLENVGLRQGLSLGSEVMGSGQF